MSTAIATIPVKAAKLDADQAHQELASLAAEVARSRAALVTRAQLLDAAIMRVREAYASDLEELIADYNERVFLLQQAVESAPDLFTKPKSTSAHGIKFGYRSKPETITVLKEAETIESIYGLLPTATHDLLLRIQTRVDKSALAGLPDDTLTAIGCARVPGSNEAFVTVPNSPLDPIIATFGVAP